MNSPPRAGLSRRSVAALIVLALLPLWLPGMFGRGLWTPDEPREADIAWRMSLQSDHTLPQLAGNLTQTWHGMRNAASTPDALARVAAEFSPELIVVKENEAHLRGREPGEVPRIIRAALLRAGVPESRLPVCPSEFEAARRALEWARPGDVLALPVHSAAARSAVLDLLGDAASPR